MTPDPITSTASRPTQTPGPAGSSSDGASFYGPRILVAAVLTSILTGPGQTIGVSVFIDPMVSALGVSRSAVSGAYLIGTLVGASAMPFFGRFVDRRGIRLAQTIVGVAFALALVNMAGVRNTVWLAIGFGGIRMMGQGALSMITTVSISLWFERNRGVAMGILSTVAGAGIVAVPLLLDWLIQTTSWRIAWLVAAATIFLTVVPLARFVLVDRPSDIGQLPDGGPVSKPLNGDELTAEELPTNDSAAVIGRPSFTRSEAVRTRQFWILAVVSTCTGMLITGLNFHQIDLLSEAGLDSGEAAAMFLPQIVGTSVSGIGVGYIIDRVGIRFVPSLAVVMLIGVHLLGAAMQPGVVVFVYAVSLGATGGAARAALSTLLPSYFGTDNIGSIQGVMTVTGVAGSAIGPVTLALVEDRLGSYRSANLALLILPVLALLFTLTNRPVPAPAVDGSPAHSER